MASRSRARSASRSSWTWSRWGTCASAAILWPPSGHPPDPRRPRHTLRSRVGRLGCDTPAVLANSGTAELWHEPEDGRHHVPRTVFDSFITPCAPHGREAPADRATITPTPLIGIICDASERRAARGAEPSRVTCHRRDDRIDNRRGLTLSAEARSLWGGQGSRRPRTSLR